MWAEVNKGSTNKYFLTDWSLSLLQGPLVHDVSEHWQQEGYGFAAAGLSDADEVSARHDGRDCLGLDGCGLLVTVPGDVTQIREDVCQDKLSAKRELNVLAERDKSLMAF